MTQSNHQLTINQHLTRNMPLFVAALAGIAAAYWFLPLTILAFCGARFWLDYLIREGKV